MPVEPLEAMIKEFQRDFEMNYHLMIVERKAFVALGSGLIAEEMGAEVNEIDDLKAG